MAKSRVMLTILLTLLSPGVGLCDVAPPLSMDSKSMRLERIVAKLRIEGRMRVQVQFRDVSRIRLQVPRRLEGAFRDMDEVVINEGNWVSVRNLFAGIALGASMACAGIWMARRNKGKWGRSVAVIGVAGAVLCLGLMLYAWQRDYDKIEVELVDVDHATLTIPLSLRPPGLEDTIHSWPPPRNPRPREHKD